ncbi:hypothetical protein C1N91_07535 [Curtobacterium sp. SGAir0471]|uniref:hypothetical protein n=1 Tax=Curtobacterium sp. SGAir0471 TaxID=2070337 RepID=UPI0010CCD9FE|nr:hypothetical protein [Curtobacterium sp. SGAir0471]QCR43420.1 hypothetical protein C1N91_07535 [Curtobacterium sp. SGAir0471]
MTDDRPRHPDKDVEKFLRDAEENHHWKFTKGKKYFKGKCPCGAHLKTVHLTPSNPNYLTNLRHYFARLDCWTQEATP